MNCAECLLLFQNLGECENKAEEISRQAPYFACETCQVSEHCSDPVKIGETLVRFVVDSTHIHEENGHMRLKSSFFSDAASFGASTIRKERASVDEYHAALEKLFEGGPINSDGSKKTLYGVVEIKTTLIKTIFHSIENKQKNTIEMHTAFGIYATGLPNRPNHADVMVDQVDKIARSKANRAGKNLTKLLESSIIKVDDFTAADLRLWAAAQKPS